MEVVAPPVLVEPSPRWVRARVGDRTVANSRRAMLHIAFGPPVRPRSRRPLLPGYFFPEADVDMSVLEPAGEEGIRRWWRLTIDGRTEQHAAWAYLDPSGAASALVGHVSLEWEAVDAWYEEAEEVFVHARDPHKRVDVLESRRHVQVSVDGLVLAESDQPFLLFETGLPTRYYFRPEDVRLDLLEPSDTVSGCPYKGTARYWSVPGAGGAGRDLAWSYPAPVPEQPRIRDLVAFFDERVDVVVDGVSNEPPRTPWS